MKIIDFMTGKDFVKDNEDIKLIVISPEGNIFLASKKYDNYLMKKDFNIPYYEDNEKCTHHKDYIQALLNRYFKDNPKYKKSMKNFTPEENLTITTNVIHQLLDDGYVIFSNITTYDGIFYQLHGTNGRIFINYPTITEKQEESLKKIEEYLKNFKEITIENYLDHKNNLCDIYTIHSNSIYNTILGKKSRSK